MNEININGEELKELIDHLIEIKETNFGGIKFSEKAFNCVQKLNSFLFKMNKNHQTKKDEIADEIEKRLTKEFNDALENENCTSFSDEEIMDIYSKAYLISACKAVITYVIIKDSSEDRTKQIEERIDYYKNTLIDAYKKF